MATESRTTPLLTTHLAAGATMTDFAGWSMPLRYGSETAEHQAVRTAAGLFDLSHMGEIDVTGPAAAAALDHALVSDISALPPGRAKYTMICAEDGGILDDLIVYRVAEHEFFVVANAANADAVATELARRVGGFDATCADVGGRWALLAVQGPSAAGVLAGRLDIPTESVRYYSLAFAEYGGFPVRLARTGYTGEDGFEIFCTPDDAPRIWAALLEDGAAAGLVPAGLACRDTLRLEAGMPLYGHELTAATTPFAAGLGRVVATAKADFVGRDALAVAAGDTRARRLVGLVMTGRRVPRAGFSVVDADGAAVGTVTSGAPSPSVGRPIAMAYVDPGCTAPGSTVAVDVRGRAEPAEVVALPFYRRPR